MKPAVNVFNESRALTGLVSVYKGSSHGLIKLNKYITTQYDFQRRFLTPKDPEYGIKDNDEKYITTKPWVRAEDMRIFTRKYVEGYLFFLFQIHDKVFLSNYDYVARIDKVSKVERARSKDKEGSVEIQSYPRQP